MWVVALPSPPAPAALIAVSLSFVFFSSSLTVSSRGLALGSTSPMLGSTETLNGAGNRYDISRRDYSR